MQPAIDFHPGMELRIPYGRDTQLARVEGFAGRFVILRRRHRGHGWNLHTDRWERASLAAVATLATVATPA